MVPFSCKPVTFALLAVSALSGIQGFVAPPSSAASGATIVRHVAAPLCMANTVAEPVLGSITSDKIR